MEDRPPDAPVPRRPSLEELLHRGPTFVWTWNEMLTARLERFDYNAVAVLARDDNATSQLEQIVARLKTRDDLVLYRDLFVNLLRFGATGLALERALADVVPRGGSRGSPFAKIRSAFAEGERVCCRQRVDEFVAWLTELNACPPSK